MQRFLTEVAHTLYERHREQLSEFSVLFPSRRARLFFVEALGEVAERPMWQPRWTTIDELMGEISGLQLGDRLRLVTELYKIYSTFHHESFDKFYFWGEMLLTDFDTIDKYRVDADQLFRNVEDIKELEADISYLTPRQLQILRFWSSLGPEADLSAEKRRFLEIWRTLNPLYHQFRERLSQLNIAYNGMMQRAAADRLEAGEFSFTTPRRFVVAGFNALSTCEKILFRFLQHNAETEFYWDFDTYYKNNPEQEAGMFIRENLLAFPPAADLTHDNMAHQKQFTSVAAVSNAVQCKYVAGILRELAQEGPLDKDTAIVLTDETLLTPLLYALPKEVGKVNVTMGYPLQQSLVYSFIERLIELQAHGRRRGEGYAFYHVDVTGLLSHPYLANSGMERCMKLREQIVEERRVMVDTESLRGEALLETVFRPIDGWEAFSEWLLEVLAAVAASIEESAERNRHLEFLTIASEEVRKLRHALQRCAISLTMEVYTSLLRRHLQTVRIPFEGEPLEGVQVMGILETRNLDFKHVIILSMTDDNFPGNRMGNSSFIPYNLRAAYELPTPEHHEGVYAYYFYRLMQRAERVWMLYCAHADEKSTGEPSRYIRQLDYESGFQVQKVEVGVDVNMVEPDCIEVEKDERVMRALERYVDPESKATLSPTALYRYVACPLRFYFHSIARLRVEDEVAEEMDAPMFGTILHAAAQALYASLERQTHPRDALLRISAKPVVQQAVERAIAEHYLHQEESSESDYTGNLLLVRNIVTRYLQQVLRYDAAHDDFAVIGREMGVDYRFPFRAAGRSLELKLAGIADRIDSLEDGRLRVVDYKTGSAHLEFAGLEALFHGEARQRQSNILQTMLYAMMLSHTSHREVVPSLYYVRTLHDEHYEPWLQDKEQHVAVEAYSHYAEHFEQLLRDTLAELYDPSIPFSQCEDPKGCTYCDFKQLCRR
nr:PD-(D/E)XK nuclease family protein [Rikenellaceae bacterium]